MYRELEIEVLNMEKRQRRLKTNALGGNDTGGRTE